MRQSSREMETIMAKEPQEKLTINTTSKERKCVTKKDWDSFHFGGINGKGKCGEWKKLVGEGERC